MKETPGVVCCIIADFVGLPAAARAIRYCRTLPNLIVVRLMPVRRGG
jgi:hypothetical protein